MSRDGFARMDVDTGWAYHRKMRRLQRLFPERWEVYAAAYWALLAEAWRIRSQEMTLEDAWCPALNCTTEEAQSALAQCRFVDGEGRVPPASWEDWVGPAIHRVEIRSEAGRKANEARWRSVRSPNGVRPQSKRIPNGSLTDPPSLPSLTKEAPLPPNGNGEAAPDILDSYYRLTARFPKGRVLAWLNEIAADHGDDVAAIALATEFTADSDPRTLLSRTQGRLEAEAHARERATPPKQGKLVDLPDGSQVWVTA